MLPILDKIWERWRGSDSVSEAQNPLRFAAAISAGSVVWGGYDLICHHQIRWNQAIAVVVAAAFLVAYFRHQRIAWLIALAIFAGLFPLNVAIYYLNSFSQPRQLITLGFMVAFWIACLIYVFWARTAYFAYVREHEMYNMTADG